MTIYWILICAWLTFRVDLTKAGHVKFTNLVCESYNESWYLVHTCRLRAVDRYKTTLNFNGTILYPVNNIELKAQFFKKGNGYKPWLYKLNFNVCQFLRKPYNPLAILIYRLIREFSNFNHTCPYLGTQIVTGLFIRYEAIRLPWPSGEFLLKGDWLFDKKPQFFTNIYFNVDE